MFNGLLWGKIMCYRCFYDRQITINVLLQGKNYYLTYLCGLKLRTAKAVGFRTNNVRMFQSQSLYLTKQAVPIMPTFHDIWPHMWNICHSRDIDLSCLMNVLNLSEFTGNDFQEVPITWIGFLTHTPKEQLLVPVIEKYCFIVTMENVLSMCFIFRIRNMLAGKYPLPSYPLYTNHAVQHRH